jgi:glycosyltransferase involved in cell wall biosynthesis
LPIPLWSRSSFLHATASSYSNATFIVFIRGTIYRPFELIIVDNQSDDPQILKYLAQLEKAREGRVLCYDVPFNYAAINNFAVQQCTRKIIGLPNNDLEIITPEWLEEMVSYAKRHVAA